MQHHVWNGRTLDAVGPIDVSDRGEVAIVIGPPAAKTALIDTDDLDTRLRQAMARASLRDAVAAVTASTGLARQQVYTRALALRGADDAS